MKFSRILLSEQATHWLRILKARTGLTPNIWCRLAFCFSLNDGRVPKPEDYDERGQEISRYTLLGEWDPLYVALLKQRLLQDGLDPEKDFVPMFRAHVNRGVLDCCHRIKSIGDLANLLPKEKGK